MAEWSTELYALADQQNSTEFWIFFQFTCIVYVFSGFVHTFDDGKNIALQTQWESRKNFGWKKIYLCAMTTHVLFDKT